MNLPEFIQRFRDMVRSAGRDQTPQVRYKYVHNFWRRLRADLAGRRRMVRIVWADGSVHNRYPSESRRTAQRKYHAYHQANR